MDTFLGPDRHAKPQPDPPARLAMLVPLAITAALAIAIARRPRRDTAVMWSMATLGTVGLIVLLTSMFSPGSGRHTVEVPWTETVYGASLDAIGVLLAAQLMIVAIDAIWRWRRDVPSIRLARATVVRK